MTSLDGDVLKHDDTTLFYFGRSCLLLGAFGQSIKPPLPDDELIKD